MKSSDLVYMKRKILSAGMEKHQSVISDFKRRIGDMMLNDGNVNEEEYDSQVQAQKAVVASDVNLLTELLNFAVGELQELRKIEANIDQIHNEVNFGSVVITDRDSFFVSVSIERFTVNDTPIFGLSVQSPMYKHMKGKKPGETFIHDGITYLIKEIF